MGLGTFPGICCLSHHADLPIHPWYMLPSFQGRRMYMRVYLLVMKGEDFGSLSTVNRRFRDPRIEAGTKLSAGLNAVVYIF
jgi:hypothetical protein